MIFETGRNLFSRQAGIAAGLLLSFYAPGIFFDGLIEKSILDFFLLSLLLWLLSRLKTTAPWSQWLAVGAVLGLLGLSRENALILVTVVPLWIALAFSESSVTKRLQWMGLFFAGLLLVLVPVGVRNLTVGGEFKLTTSQFGPNFYIGNNPLADGTYVSVGNVIGEPQLEGKDAKRLAERALGRSLTAGEVSDYWLSKSWDYIRAQAGQWVGLFGKKWLLVWNAREIEDSDDFYIYQQWSWLLSFLGWINHFGMLAPLAAVGVLLTVKQWRQLWFLYAMILALAASAAVFYVFGRYRFPLVPFLALFAGAGIASAVALYRKAGLSSVDPRRLAAVVHRDRRQLADHGRPRPWARRLQQPVQCLSTKRAGSTRRFARHSRRLNCNPTTELRVTISVTSTRPKADSIWRELIFRKRSGFFRITPRPIATLASCSRNGEMLKRAFNIFVRPLSSIRRLAARTSTSVWRLPRKAGSQRRLHRFMKRRG